MNDNTSTWDFFGTPLQHRMQDLAEQAKREDAERFLEERWRRSGQGLRIPSNSEGLLQVVALAIEYGRELRKREEEGAAPERDRFEFLDLDEGPPEDLTAEAERYRQATQRAADLAERRRKRLAAKTELPNTGEGK